ncbi:hypothetical protein [Clostridium aminobutyricum]|uniref:Uncharacterized protein n=1 Tax=Clostridium aminobutyricum TaxID=33953 RepID=A0A939IHR8_CLOAM|nr:hypothetical protein [Clostridium aminobutyricum]MBN7771823.1 hypothetical protein [Clostridium aminobutyricum]
MENRTGYVTISYGVKGDFNMIHMQMVVLIVSHDTSIQNKFGRTISFRDLREGMIIDAEFSTVMTSSIPPQSRAFRITVMDQNRSSHVVVDEVLSVDLRNRFLYTGNARDLSSQMKFLITDNTTILNSRGNSIPLKDIRPGQIVRVKHASFQTMSIPPQTTAFGVRVL